MVHVDAKQAQELVELIHAIHAKGWSPATSTNYSFRNSAETIAISQSGIDKSKFNIDHFMLMDFDGMLLPQYAQLKPSAETLLHLVLYQENPHIQVILHTHSVYATVLSRQWEHTGGLVLEGYEMLKALPNIGTHEVAVTIPIFANTQNIQHLSEDFRLMYQSYPSMPAYLIAGHGIYTWGRSLAEAKRSLEALEFLLECEYRSLMFV